MKKQNSIWRGSGIRMFLLACTLMLSSSALGQPRFIADWASPKYISCDGTNTFTVSGTVDWVSGVTNFVKLEVYADNSYQAANKLTEINLSSYIPSLISEKKFKITTGPLQINRSHDTNHRLVFILTYNGSSTRVFGNDGEYAFQVDNVRPYLDPTEPITFSSHFKKIGGLYFIKTNTPGATITVNGKDDLSGIDQYFGAKSGNVYEAFTNNDNGTSMMNVSFCDKAGNKYKWDKYDVEYYEVDWYCDGAGPVVTHTGYEAQQADKMYINKNVTPNKYWFAQGATVFAKAEVQDTQRGGTVSGRGSGVDNDNTTLNGAKYNSSKKGFDIKTTDELSGVCPTMTLSDKVGNQNTGVALAFPYGIDGTAPQIVNFINVLNADGKPAYGKNQGAIYYYWLKQSGNKASVTINLKDYKNGSTSEIGSGIDCAKTNLMGDKAPSALSFPGDTVIFSNAYDEANGKFAIDCTKETPIVQIYANMQDNLGWYSKQPVKKGTKPVFIGIDGAGPTIKSWNFTSSHTNKTSDFTGCADVTYPQKNAKGIVWFNAQDLSAKFTSEIRDYINSTYTKEVGSGVDSAVLKVQGTADYNKLVTKSNIDYETDLYGKYHALNKYFTCEVITVDNVGNNSSDPNPKFGFDAEQPVLHTNYGRKIFNATDELSGVARIEYSIANTTSWQTYLGDSTLLMNLSATQAEPKATFYMRAIDNVGNPGDTLEFYVKEKNIIQVMPDGNNKVIWAPINEDGVPEFYMALSDTDPLAITAIDRSIYNGKDVSYLILAVEVPEEVNFIGDSAFFNCGNIEEVLIFNEKQVPDAFAHTFEGLDPTKATLYGEFDFIEPDDPMTDTYLNYKDGGKYVYNKYVQWQDANDHFLEVLPLTPPANQIWYMTDDRKPLNLDDTSEFLRNNFNRVDTAQTYLRSMGKIFFDGPLNRIGVAAFRGNQRITKLYLPDTALYIGQDAFRDCPQLRRVTLPNYDRAYNGEKTAEIGPNAFENCTNLQKIRFGRGLETIDAYAFARCEKLYSVKLPASLKNIYGNAFSYNPNLTVVTMQATSMDRLWVESFEKCNPDLTIKVPYLSLYSYKQIAAAKGLNFQTVIPAKSNWQGMFSFYSPNNFVVPTGTSVYNLKRTNATTTEPDVEFKAGEVVAGGQGYFVSAPGTCFTTFEFVTTAKAATKQALSILTGTYKPNTTFGELKAQTDATNLYLQDEDKTWNVPVTNDAEIVAPYTAILLKKGNEDIKLRFAENGDVTGIEAVNVDDDDNDNSYNTAGQKVSNSYRGIVIKNGKKYFNK